MANDNSEQIQFWNGDAGTQWVAAQDRLDAMLGPLSTQAIAALQPRKTDRILDVGCGCGGTSIELAAQCSAVQGVDISRPMLGRARSRASARTNLTFVEADAAVHPFGGDFDIVFSRFGVMFFSDPVAAFKNLRTALKPGGRLHFICWQAVKDNPWIAIPMGALGPFMPAPAAPPDPRAPGPFAFADQGYLKEILGGAGFDKVHIAPLAMSLRQGGTLDEAMQFLKEIGPLARVVSELPADKQGPALAAARAALEPHQGKGGAAGVHLGAACWMVSATNG